MKCNGLLAVILLGHLFLASSAFAQHKSKTKNVVLILIDGYRWQELFHGAEYDLLTNPRYNTMDSAKRMQQFWDKDLDKRRAKLMPFVWSHIAQQGQLYGNRDYGNKVNVKNPYWFSYPGRAEVLSGFVDEKVNSNNYGINTNDNVLEFLNARKEFKNKVVTFACWGATGRCLNKPNSDMLINVPWENIEGQHLTPAEVLANQIQHYAPKTFGIIERLDFEVYALASAYIQAHHPRVTYLDFGDPDEYAHGGHYDKYLLDVHNLDEMIGNLWKMMQNDKFYKGKTTFVVVPDHGRGIGKQWTSHGTGAPHSDETWLMVMGPDTPPSGEMKTKVQIYQDQFAATLTRVLGLEYKIAHPTGDYIESVIR